MVAAMVPGQAAMEVVVGRTHMDMEIALRLEVAQITLASRASIGEEEVDMDVGNRVQATASDSRFKDA